MYINTISEFGPWSEKNITTKSPQEHQGIAVGAPGMSRPNVYERWSRQPSRLLAHSLDGPLLLAEWAAIVLLDPEWHAAVVKGVIALAPDDHAVLLPVEVLLALGLAAQTGVWNNGTFVMTIFLAAIDGVFVFCIAVAGPVFGQLWEYFLARAAYSRKLIETHDWIIQKSISIIEKLFVLFRTKRMLKGRYIRDKIFFKWSEIGSWPETGFVAIWILLFNHRWNSWLKSFYDGFLFNFVIQACMIFVPLKWAKWFFFDRQAK